MKIDDKRLLAFVRESNQIEGILSQPHILEVEAHETLLRNPSLSIEDVCMFVEAIARAKIRDKRGMNVFVGNHVPPPGGAEIPEKLADLLRRVIEMEDPYVVHTDYETLHPFMDGNGRSGRALWLWQMLRRGYDMRRLFLHEWYYQSLSHRSA